MSARSCLLIGVVIALMAATGCHESAKRLNAPPQGSSDNAHAMQENTVRMVDNAMLHDMSVADVHFVPHTCELNGLGVRRLNRYAELLATYGGMLHYETYEADELMIQKRVDRVVAYLADSGLNMDKVSVEPGTSRGRGARATDAIQRMQPKDNTPTRRVINVNKTE